MTRTARWIECDTKGCDARYTSWDESLPAFRESAQAAGWGLMPRQCPDCASQGSVDPSTDRIMVIPLTHGAFTAYAPEHMTPTDWALVADVCKSMSQNGTECGDSESDG